MQNVIKSDHMMRDQLLQVMIDNSGSDMYITVGTHPAIKIAGEIISIDQGIEPLTWKDTLEFAQSLIDDMQHEKLLRQKNLDFSFSFI
jgi:Tfp pilus assembly ATPase PilU